MGLDADGTVAEVRRLGLRYNETVYRALYSRTQGATVMQA